MPFVNEPKRCEHINKNGSIFVVTKDRTNEFVPTFRRFVQHVVLVCTPIHDYSAIALGLSRYLARSNSRALRIRAFHL